MKHPRPAKVTKRPISWRVIGSAQATELTEPLACLSAQDYQDLALTMEDTIRWMRQAGYIIILYEQDTDLFNEYVREQRRKQTQQQPEER